MTVMLNKNYFEVLALEGTEDEQHWCNWESENGTTQYDSYGEARADFLKGVDQGLSMRILKTTKEVVMQQVSRIRDPRS